VTSFNYSIADSNKPYWVWGPLLFSAFYFLPLVMNSSQFSLVNMVNIVALYLGFLLLYSKAVYAKGDQVIIWLIALTLLVSLGTSITYGTQSLFGYIAFVAGFNLTLKKSSSALIILFTAILLSAYFFADFNA